MNCNVLLMGLTGVGKSSLINYLAGQNLAEAGIAASSGGLTRGIHKYPVIINGQTCMISDTEGLEASHSSFWENMMEKELLKVNYDKDISEWYHIVIYCIGANGGRVQDIELKMLKQLDEAGYGVIVAFTKADLASEDDLTSLRSAIENDYDYEPSFQYIPVCSKKTRSNELEGKEELSCAILDAWGMSMIQRMPAMVYDRVLDSIKEWADETINWISRQEIGLGILTQTKDDVLNNLNSRVSNKVRNYQNEISSKKEKAFREISNIYSMLNVVLDTQSLANLDSSFCNKIEKLESNFVFESNTERNSWLAVGGGGLLLAAPYLAPILGIGALFLKAFDSDKQREEMASAFFDQAVQINRNFIEQKYALRCSLTAMLGYMFGYRELGICYLKGRGIQQDYDKFIECMNEIINFSNTTEYNDPISEYYIGYAFYLSDDKENANYWFKLSSDHGYERATMILNGRNIDRVEELNDQDYEQNWE